MSTAGKPPLLQGRTPSDLRAFVTDAKLFFSLKAIKEDSQKITWISAGLRGEPELQAWYLANETAFDTKKYEDFLAELRKRALPLDFVWTPEGRIRGTK